jgi:hypothetical protein
MNNELKAAVSLRADAAEPAAPSHLGGPFGTASRTSQTAADRLGTELWACDCLVGRQGC